jgi:hypothetical protein
MTRRKPPPPTAFAWRPGEPGSVSQAVVLVPRPLRDRYGAVADIVEPEGHDTAPAVLLVTITDRETGAVAEVRGDRVTLPSDGTPEAIARLWADARTIASAPVRRGRPPGTPVTDAAIRDAVSELVKAGRLVTLDTIIAASGRFTYDQLRYHLRKYGRHLSDYR